MLKPSNVIFIYMLQDLEHDTKFPKRLSTSWKPFSNSYEVEKLQVSFFSSTAQPFFQNVNKQI